MKIESDQQFFTHLRRRRSRDAYLAYAVDRLLRQRRPHLLGGARGRPRTAPAAPRVGCRSRAGSRRGRGRRAPARWGNAIEIEAALDRRPDRRRRRADADRPRPAHRPRPVRGAAPSPTHAANLLRVRDAASCRRFRRAPSSGSVTGAASVAGTARDLSGAPRPLSRGGADGLAGDSTLDHLIGDPDDDVRRGRRRARSHRRRVVRRGARSVCAGARAGAHRRRCRFARRRGPRRPDRRSSTRCLRARAIAWRILDCRRESTATPMLRHRSSRCRNDELRAPLYHPWIAGRRSAAASSGLVRVRAAVGPRGRHVRAHRPAARRAQAAGQRSARGRLRRCASRSTTRPTAGSTTPRVNAIRAVPGRGVLVLGARTLEPRLPLALRQRAPAVHDDRGSRSTSRCSGSSSSPTTRSLWRDIDRAVRGFLERLYRAGHARRRDFRRGLLRCAATTPPIRRADTDDGPRDLRRSACSRRIRPSSSSCASASRAAASRSRNRGRRMSKTGARLDPAPAFRFTVTFDDLPPGGFTRLHRPAVGDRGAGYAEGGAEHAHLAACPAAPSRATSRFKRGIVSKVLWDWYRRDRAPADSSRATARSSCTTRRASDDLHRVPARRRLSREVDRARSCRRSAEQPRDRDARSGASGAAAEEVSAMPRAHRDR